MIEWVHAKDEDGRHVLVNADYIIDARLGPDGRVVLSFLEGIYADRTLDDEDTRAFLEKNAGMSRALARHVVSTAKEKTAAKPTT